MGDQKNKFELTQQLLHSSKQAIVGWESYLGLVLDMDIKLNNNHTPFAQSLDLGLVLDMDIKLNNNHTPFAQSLDLGLF